MTTWQRSEFYSRTYLFLPHRNQSNHSKNVDKSTSTEKRLKLIMALVAVNNLISLYFCDNIFVYSLPCSHSPALLVIQSFKYPFSYLRAFAHAVPVVCNTFLLHFKKIFSSSNLSFTLHVAFSEGTFLTHLVACTTVYKITILSFSYHFCTWNYLFLLIWFLHCL